MAIDPTAATSPLYANNETQPTQGGTLGTQDEFLKLFIAQLENQNPLEPQDGSEFVAQLAQFTTVEQSAETNRRLGEILAGQMSASNASLASFVGRTGTVSADQFAITGRGEGVPALGVQLPQAASKVEVVIRDAAGKQVKRIELGPQSAGKVSIPWDGTSDTGAPLAQGNYQVEVRATGNDGSATEASATMSGLIQAIDFIDGVPRLRLGAVSAAPSDVLSIE
jgi:flagellar basal-body rod modification protein FlgD